MNSTQQLGRPVSGFSLPALEGPGEWTLDACLERKTGALIVFWSAVCTHCVRYDPYFNSFTERHPQIAFAAIASRYGESRDEMQAAVARRNLGFRILVDSQGAAAREWQAQQTPRCYLIAPGRTLLYRGAIDNFKLPDDDEYRAYLEPAIEAFLAGRPIARPETASFGCAIRTVYYHLPKQL